MAQVEKNVLQEQADDYLREHHIVELFEDLCTGLSFHQPDNVNEFLIQQLQLKKEKGLKTGLFASEEITNIFKLFDLKKEGYINKQRCIEALQVLASSEFLFNQVQRSEIPSKVDEKCFKELCESILGLK